MTRRMAASSSYSCSLKSPEGKPRTAKPRSPYVACRRSSASNCGVKPHLLAVFAQIPIGEPTREQGTRILTQYATAFPGVAEGFKTIYTYAWFVGVAIAAVVYGVMMKGKAVAHVQQAPQS